MPTTLYGNFISPYVRRAAITMQLHGIDYELSLARRHLAAATVRAVLVWTLGMVRWNPASAREDTMIDLTLRGAAHACEVSCSTFPTKSQCGPPSTVSPP